MTSDYNEWRLPSGMRREADDEGDESEDSEGEEEVRLMTRTRRGRE